MKNQWVKNLQPGSEVATFFGIFDLTLTKTKNGAKYLRITLGDRTGKIEARVWDPEHAEKIHRHLAPGDIAAVRGRVVEFNGLQINVEHCQKSDKKQLNLDDYRPTTEKDIPELLHQFGKMLATIKTTFLKKLLDSIFTEGFLENFAHATAARKIHHAYAGGLLEHTLEVMIYSAKIANVQGKFLNSDLLLAGAALHDIGKLWEYDQQDFNFNRTREGRLLGGHVILGRDYLKEKIRKLDNFPVEAALHIEHLILSHHGQREWGAIEEPKTIEAVALHHADLLSARLNQVAQLIKNQPGNDSWTNYDRFLGRSILMPATSDKFDFSLKEREGI